ncbi:MAG: fatty acid desaturase [Paracoccaceae bacterium]
MDHKTFLQTLDQTAKARLIARADGPGLWHLAGHGGMILLLGVLIAARVPFWWLLLLPQGILLVFLFTLQHECTHKTPFASDRLNEWVGWLTGVILFQPFLWFRYFHFAHHRHTNDPDLDPELSAAKPDTWPGFLRHLSTVDYWADKATLLAQTATGRIDAPYLPPNTQARLRREAWGMLILYLAALVFSLTISPILLFVWILPVLLGFPFLRLYLLAEHGRCPYVADMFVNTRTTYTNRIVHFLAWNMPYHAEHHCFPQVPYHRLPDLHGMVQAHLRSTSDGYAEFTADYVRGFAHSGTVEK